MARMTRWVALLTLAALLLLPAAAFASEGVDEPVLDQVASDQPADTRHRGEGEANADRAVDHISDGLTHVADGDRVSDRAADADRVTDRVTDRVPDRVTDRATDRVSDRPCMSDRVDDCCPDRANDRCERDHPSDRVEWRELILRLIKAHEWEKLVRLLHAYGIV